MSTNLFTLITLGFRLSLLAFITSCMIGCDSPLSREEAKRAIIASRNLPLKDIRQINFTKEETFQGTIPYTKELMRKFTNSIRPDKSELQHIGNTPRKIDLFKKLEAAGLAKYSIQYDNVRIVGSPRFHYASATDWTQIYENFPVYASAIHTATVSGEGKKYLIGENTVEVATIEFGDITGIVERKGLNVAEVKYTLKRTRVTPFGRVVFNLTESITNETSSFTKYDDGWKINK